RVRVIAHGYATGLAVSAALAAVEGRPAGGPPVVERVTGVGISLASLRDRYPDLFARARAAEAPAVGEWNNLWSDRARVPRTFHLETWRPGDPEFIRVEFGWGAASWPVIVRRVSSLGSRAYAYSPLAPTGEGGDRVRPLQSREGRVFRKRAGKNDGKKVEKRVEDLVVGDRPVAGRRPEAEPGPERKRPPITKYSVSSSGWVFRPPPGFRTFGLSAGTVDVWSKGPFRISMHYGQGRNSGRSSRSVCRKHGIDLVRADHHGHPAEICKAFPSLGITGGETLYSDYFTVVGDLYGITVHYSYPQSRRDEELDTYMTAIEALTPAR
ncbi:MAG: hypothetical protein ABII00_12990, partial [Elusimicrobiota bacterium]